MTIRERLIKIETELKFIKRMIWVMFIAVISSTGVNIIQ